RGLAPAVRCPRAAAARHRAIAQSALLAAAMAVATTITTTMAVATAMAAAVPTAVRLVIFLSMALRRGRWPMVSTGLRAGHRGIAVVVALPTPVPTHDLPLV